MILQQKQRPQISIIVPVYNAQQWLPACIKAIKGQTAGDFECILVNDGSTDGSGALCDDCVKQDSRFLVVHKQNAGVSAARNTGLEVAKGRYIVFCDADDIISPTTFQVALAAQSQNPDDCICWLLTRNEEALEQQTAKADTLYTAAQHRVYITTIAGHSNCNKLFSAHLIRTHQLRYDTALSRAEDYEFGGRYFAALFAASPAAVIRQLNGNFYYWRNNPTSATNTTLASADASAQVGYDPADFPQYARHMLKEYAATSATMNGWQGMSAEDLAPQLRSYLRRFAFSVWTAHKLGEKLPEGFFSSPEISETLALLKQMRAFSAYYLLFRWRCKGLIRRVYDSDESGRMRLYRFVYTASYYLLGGGWNQV